MATRIVQRDRQPVDFVQDQRGIALLMTILMLSLLVVTTMEYHRNTWRMLLDSNSFLVNYRLRAMADSGVNIGLGMLATDGADGDNDSLLDSWAALDTEMLTPLFQGGKLDLKIIDQSGLLPLNNLLPAQGSETGEQTADNSEALQSLLMQLLASGRFAIEDETAAKTVVDSLLDWLDSDEDESEFGAEESYYRSLDPPYGCRNGSILNVEELLLVRGITPELLYGTDEKEGLVNYVTVNGTDGKINLNTAPVLLVQSMNPLLDEQMVESFDEFRRDEQNETVLVQPDWYKNVSGWPGDIVLVDEMLTTVSRNFRIIANAGSDNRLVTVTADVERDENGTLTFLRKTVE